MSIILSAPKRNKIFYFCDETSYIDSDEFMAVGGVAIKNSSLIDIENKIIAIREKMNINKEIKWSNAKARRDNGHKAYADLLFELVKSNYMHFHIRFQRTQDWDHRRAGPRLKQDTVSMAFYQLILHRPATMYGSKSDIHVRPDAGDCTSRLHSYIGQLNTEASKSYRAGIACVKSIHTIDSKESNFLQLLDVTLGGLAAIKNKRHEKEDVSEHKKALALYIHSLWDNFDLSKSHLKKERKFNVWNAIPKN